MLFTRWTTPCPGNRLTNVSPHIESTTNSTNAALSLYVYYFNYFINYSFAAEC